MLSHAPVSFPDWKATLAHSKLTPAMKSSHLREIITFLHHCRKCHAPATVVLIQQWLAARELSPEGPAQTALRWFYREASHKQTGLRNSAATGKSGATSVPSATSSEDQALPAAWSKAGEVSSAGDRSERKAMPGSSTTGSSLASRPMEPPPAAQDRGNADWEKALIKTMRERGMLWRSEETCRGWGRRFVRFIHPRSPYAASDKEVAAFLSDLAVRGRSSPATQKQALNALVFLMQEALSRQLGEMKFQRAYPQERVPTVLTKDEIARLFQRLEGSTLLMAELAYGSGIRLMELLRLRIHHLDLDRRQLKVHGGKGDKDRVTLLPEKLVPKLSSKR